MIRIVIADDHPLVRKGLREILDGEIDIEVVAEASNGQETLDVVRKTKPSVLLTDLSMPGVSALDIIAELKKEFPKLPVLVLTMHPEDRFAVRSLRSGASGYLTKDSAPEEIIKAVRMLAAGKRYITSSLAEKLAIEIDKDQTRLPHETLSNREFQIMCALASGMKVKAIADKLSISIHTVNTHKARIMQKMDMKTIPELTLYAVENHLIE